jgi:proteasome accessory factor B
MPISNRKRDRTARLLRVGHLLYQHPKGLRAKEVADRIGVTVRTAYRDLHALEDELEIPIWEGEGRFGVLPTAFLPPLNLTLVEAVTLFLSARLMARFSDRRNEHIVRAYGSLAAVLPTPIAQHVYATVAAIDSRPDDHGHASVFETVVRGWAQHLKIAVTYAHSTSAGEILTSHRRLAPYFMEPHPTGHTLYILAHDSASDQVRTFKLERIQSAALTDESFEIPGNFDPDSRLRNSWVVTDEPTVEVRLLFHDLAAAERARENRWHMSQREVDRDDGKLELRFQVAGLLEIQSWILGWGDAVEVLSPSYLRVQIAKLTERMASRYSL